MTHAPAEIVPPGLSSHLCDTYGLAVTTISSVPKGEDADAYCATTTTGDRYFVRVEHGRRDNRLEVALAASAALRVQGDLHAVVAPLPTTQGAMTSRLGVLTVALFPYVDGATATDFPLGEPDWQRLAAFMATLHASDIPRGIGALPRETFANPFAATIRRTLQRAASTDTWSLPCQQPAAALLLANRADLELMLTGFARLGDLARRLGSAMVLTHGDPNLSNVLRDNLGALHVIDWGGLGLGPRERDLMAFTEERFAIFLEGYLARAGLVRLHLDLFAFYALRWVLQEIADYGSRLLLEPVDAEGQAHAWRELQPYLPIPHAALAADHEAVRQTFAPFERTGQVTLHPGTP